MKVPSLNPLFASLSDSPSSLTGRVRFVDTQTEVTGFSDDENLTPSAPPSLTTPELSARRPGSGSKSSSPNKTKRDRQSPNGRKSSTQKLTSQGSSNSIAKRSSALPSIIGLNDDKPKVPNDTMKALQGTEYRPKSPKHMVNIERSFSSS